VSAPSEPCPICGSYHYLYLDIHPPSLQVGDSSHIGATQLVRPIQRILAAPQFRTAAERDRLHAAGREVVQRLDSLAT
jgi:hypothetical protein